MGMNFDVSLVVHESKPILGRRTCTCTCRLVLCSQRVAFGRSKRKPFTVSFDLPFMEPACSRMFLGNDVSMAYVAVHFLRAVRYYVG